MPDRAFNLRIVTPDRVVLDDEAVSLVAPGIDGYLGVLYNHAPLVTELGVGELRYTDAEREEHRVAVSGGFMEVLGTRTTVLADAAERAEEINTERARRALERAQSERQELGEQPDPARAAELDLEIRRAHNRLQVANAG